MTSHFVTDNDTNIVIDYLTLQVPRIGVDASVDSCKYMFPAIEEKFIAEFAEDIAMGHLQ